jgi:hypothetical protein
MPRRNICGHNRSFNPLHSIRAGSCLLEYTVAGSNKLEFRKAAVECSSESACNHKSNTAVSPCLFSRPQPMVVGNSVELRYLEKPLR